MVWLVQATGCPNLSCTASRYPIFYGFTAAKKERPITGSALRFDIFMDTASVSTKVRVRRVDSFCFRTDYTKNRKCVYM